MLKDGDFKQYKHNFTLSYLAGSLASEGPVLKDKLSYLLTARRSFIDLIYNGAMSLLTEGEGGGAMIAFYNIKGINTNLTGFQNKNYRLKKEKSERSLFFCKKCFTFAALFVKK